MARYVLVEEGVAKMLADSLKEVTESLAGIVSEVKNLHAGCAQLGQAFEKLSNAKGAKLIVPDEESSLCGATVEVGEDEEAGEFEGGGDDEESEDLYGEMGGINDPYGDYTVNDCDSCPHASGDSLDVCEQCRYRAMHPSGIWDDTEY